MFSSIHKIIFILYLQFNQILNIIANGSDLKHLMGDRESADWPLQAGYPGLSIKNINEYVSLFSHCLVNIQNYQGIEIIGIKSPVYISRFDVANLKPCLRPPNSYKETYRFLFGKIPQKSERNCTTDYDQAVLYDDKSLKSRWYCKAQFDLFFPEPLDDPHLYKHFDFDTIDNQKPEIRKERVLFDIELDYFKTFKLMREAWSFVAARPQPAYYLLVHNQNASTWMRKFWTDHIDELWTTKVTQIFLRKKNAGIRGSITFTYHRDIINQVRGQTFWIFHLKTNNLEENHVRSIIARPFVSIQSLHFVFPFCTNAVGSILIRISKNTWEAEATRLSDFSSFLPLRVGPADFTPRPPWMMDQSFFNTEFTLRNLLSRPKASLLDRGLAEFIFPNTTFINAEDERCFCCKLTPHHNSSLERIEHVKVKQDEPKLKLFNYELPYLKLNEFYYQTMFPTGGDEYTFLSCGDPHIDPPNFLALFMPFSQITWALIFVTIFGWPLVLSLIENDFHWKNVLKDFDALFIGFAMILEQSHLRATNYKGRGSLYCYCGCVILALLILSNAYKGDNIQTLTKSFELVPLTNIDQVIRAGYQTWGNKYCRDYEYPVKNESCSDQFQSVAKHKGFRKSLKQIKIWKPMNHNFMEFRVAEDIELKVKLYGKCNKMALLDWRGHLVDIEKELRIKYKSASIYLGQEFIFTRSKGWKLRRYGSIKVLKRMWTIVESGVYGKLLNSYKKPPVDKIVEPRSIKVEGNIFVQFVFHSCGLLIALLFFVAELYIRIYALIRSMSEIFGSLINNFLKQSQKGLFLGVKYFNLLNTRNKSRTYPHKYIT